mgnify:CR=1 FL=1
MFAYRELESNSLVRSVRNAESRAANYGRAMDTEGGALLGEQLKRWRKARRLTLEQVAADIETSKGHLSDMERNKRPLNSRWLAKIASVYSVPVSEIIGTLPAPRDDDEGLAEASDLLRKLRDRGKLDQVRSYLRFLEAEGGNIEAPYPAGEVPEKPKSTEPR